MDLVLGLPGLINIVDQSQIWCKLNRALVNQVFIDSFLEAISFFPEPGISDHSPVMIFFGPFQEKPKWFRFISFWTDTEEFKLSLSKIGGKGVQTYLNFREV